MGRTVRRGRTVGRGHPPPRPASTRASNARHPHAGPLDAAATRPPVLARKYRETGPAATLFENAAGARVAVLAAGCGSGNSLTAPGLSFYDEDRKRELVELLAFVCGRPIPFYYPGDAEVYLKLRRFADGRHLLALFNLGHDPLEVIPLVSAHPLAEAETLAPDGAWQRIAFADGCLPTPLLPAEPRVFRIRTRESA